MMENYSEVGMRCKVDQTVATDLEGAETRPSRESDVADVGRRGRGHRLIDHKGAVLQLGTTLGLHLPELLQRLHHVHCKQLQA